MSSTIFPILDDGDFPMVGRGALLDDMWARLTKTSPDNVSLVGPKRIGKTVLLKSLVERARKGGSPYALVIYCHLGYTPPQSDNEFISVLCDVLISAMVSDDATYEHYISYLRESRTLPALKEVLDELQGEGRVVLMVWDGFDTPLSQGRLTGTLFGNLRDLFHGKVHRLVTATRQSQTELARSIDVEDSPFWEMFGANLLRIGPFDSVDIETAIGVAGINIEQGGKKELANWTGGHPVLLLSTLNVLAEGGGDIDNEHVNDAARRTSDELSDTLDMLWRDCGPDDRSAFDVIVESAGGVEVARVGKQEARDLIARGFVVRVGEKLKPSCRMMEHHVRGLKPNTSALERMFGTWDAYRTEMRSVLELRLGQIRVVDNQLHRRVRQCLKDIPEYPDDCLNSLTSIEESAFDVIWRCELNGQGSLPSDVIASWTTPPCSDDKLVKRMMEQDDWRVPRERYQQLAVLQRLTGCTPDFEPMAKTVLKDTYVLLNAIHQFRNRSEHAEGQSMDTGVAVSVVLMCIELLSCLERGLDGALE